MWHAFEQDLRSHKVRMMFYNKQASNKAVQRLVDIAHDIQDPRSRRDRDRTFQSDVSGLDAGAA